MVVTPLHDRNRLRFIPYQGGTFALIGLNVLVFLWQQTLPEATLARVFVSGGLIPATLLGDAVLPPELAALPPWATLVTCAFLHADVWHLAGNMLFLWVFGDNVEDAVGSAKFVAFYLICAAAAALGHAALQPDSTFPLIGASGATSGLVGAYLVLYPRVSVWVLVLGKIPVALPAVAVVGAWLATQAFFVLMPMEEANVAWDAHLAGFAAGAMLIAAFKRPEVPLFGPAGPGD